MRRNSEKDKKLADDERLLCAWRAWHAEELTKALAGPHRHVLEPLMQLLKNLDLHSSNALVDFIRAQDWSAIDAQTKLVVLHETIFPLGGVTIFLPGGDTLDLRDGDMTP